MGKATSLSFVYASRQLCANGCGRRTASNRICAECVRLVDPEVIKTRRHMERLLELRHLAVSGAPIQGTCLTCGHWNNRCLMEIPEVSVSFAPKCACYLEEG